MASSSGEDDAPGAWGERGSPPLRFGCFAPRFWKKRKALLSSSSTTAAVGSASSVSRGERGDSAPLLTAKIDAENRNSDTQDASAGEGDDSGSVLIALNNANDLNTTLEDFSTSAQDFGSSPKVEGSHSPSFADASDSQEEDCLSPSTEVVVSIQTGTDTPCPLSWDEVPFALDHLILSHTPSFYDRCKMRCVCRRWCDATRSYPRPPPPLPMVINADFTLLNCFADGRSALARQIKTPALLLQDQHTACVGSIDDWVVCVYPRAWDARQSVMLSDQCCYILAPSKQRLIHLPDPPAYQKVGRLHGKIQVENCSSTLSYTQPSTALDITLNKVVLTAEPDTGNCKVASISDRRGRRHLALCMVGMASWCFYASDFITIGTDLEFFEDSLYLLANDNGDLYVLDFGPQFDLYPVVTHAEKCSIDQLPAFKDNDVHTCNLVKFNKKLLLVVRKFPDTSEQMTGVDVYLLDNKSEPWKWVATNNLDGHCILFSSAHNKSYPAYLYDEIEEDTIYFLDSMDPGYLPREDENFTYRVMVYNLKDKRIGIRLIGSKPAGLATKFPMWYCPVE